jgi:ATP synthase protein I
MPDRPPRRPNYRKVAALSSLGLMLPSSIAIGLFMGYFLDKLLGTDPWLLIIFTLFGVASGFLSLFRGLKKLGLDKDDGL